MKDLFQIVIRSLISLSVITTVLFYNFDFKVPFVILSTFYLIQYIVLSPFLKEKILKYVVYLIDYLFLGYVVYITDNVYLSLFFIPFIMNAKNKFDVLVLSSFTIPILLLTVYKSGVFEFTILYVLTGLILSILEFFKSKNQLEKKYNKVVELSKDLYKDNLLIQDKMDFYSRFYNITNVIKRIRERKIEPKDAVKILYDNLNADGVIVYDRESDRCYYDGNFNCNEELIETLKNRKVNLDTKYVVIRDLGHIYLVIVYREYILVDQELLEATV